MTPVVKLPAITLGVLTLITSGFGLFATAADTAVPIVFDTDIDTDCDDVGAVACLHSLAGLGEIEILATTVSSNYEYSAPCLDALNRYYGRPDLPVGVPGREAASTHRGSRYAKEIAFRYPSRFKTNQDAPSAVDVLRQALAKANDGSVRIVTVGYLTNVADLLRSPVDQHSPLTGMELVRQKVHSLIVMGGRYPEHLDPREFGNFKPDPESAVYVARQWPGAIHFSGDGEQVGTGLRRTELPSTHPMRVAYDLYLHEKATRPSWDQVALMFAVRPDADYWNVTKDGGNKIFDNGTNQWVDDDPADHRLVEVRTERRQALTDEIETLMMRQDAKAQLAGIQPSETVAYKTVGDVTLDLHVFRPKVDGDGPRPAVVFFFGGGWKAGTVTQFYPHCRHLASLGIVAMAADYRVASRHQVLAKSCVDDAKDAIRFVRKNAAKWKIDPKRIAAGGGSAGGHLAAATATLPDFANVADRSAVRGLEDLATDRRSGQRRSAGDNVHQPNLLLLFNPALVLADIPGKFAMPDKNADQLRKRIGVPLQQFSPYQHLDKDLPPTIVFHGDADTTVGIKTARWFEEKADSIGVTCQLVEFPGEGHGFFNFTRGDGTNYRQTLVEVDAFLREQGFLP